MGATLQREDGKHGTSLARKIQKYRTACAKAHVVAGYISGLSSPASIEKARKNEFGAPASDLGYLGIRIPARPFMHMSIPQMKENISEIAGSFHVDRPQEFLNRAGEMMADSIRESIDDGGFQENSEYTLMLKRGTTPLRDTGEMYAEATHQLRKS